MLHESQSDFLAIMDASAPLEDHIVAVIEHVRSSLIADEEYKIIVVLIVGSVCCN